MAIKSFRNQPLTVGQLYTLVRNEMLKGNAEKHVFISQDDEGNGYHALWFGFMEPEDVRQLAEYGYLDGINHEEHPEDADNITVLG